MFFIIYIAIIVLALYLILHDRGEGEGKSRRTQNRTGYRPEQPGPVPQTPVVPKTQAPVSPAPKPLEPAPAIKPVAPRPAAPTVRTLNIMERPLSWEYLSTLDYDEDIDGDTMEAEIAGMKHYCTLADLGPVNGIIKPEPENPHDPRAHVVLRADGKKLGYIPRSMLDDFEDFNGDDLVCPFAGQIKATPQGFLWADILIALPESLEYVLEELTEYVS